MSEERPLTGRNLVLKRQGDMWQLPTTDPITCRGPKELPPEAYLLFRVERLDESDGTLEIKYQKGGRWEEKAFATSVAVNDAILKAAIIKRVFIHPVLSPIS